jgi:hypothetical protein
LATPALAMSDSEQAKLDAASSSYKAYLGESNQRMKEFHAARAIEKAQQRKAEQAAIDRRCAKLGTARIGLDAEGVRKSCWGYPQRINTTTNARGTHEQWVYGGGYLYLDDGVVTSIQTNR